MPQKTFKCLWFLVKSKNRGAQPRSQGLSSSLPLEQERRDPGLSSLAPGEGKSRDPGNEVGGCSGKNLSELRGEPNKWL